jgi:glycosyltransferase involved in cell wall biosynthesis
VTFLAGLQRYKGVWDLLAAAKILRDRKDIVFNVYGGNCRPREFYRSWFGRACGVLGLDSDMESRVRSWVGREGLSATVRVLGNVVPEPWLFHATEILVFPSHLFGVGRSVFEAGVYGIPSIVTMREKVEDIVQDNVTGLFAKPQHPLALAQAIQRLADDDQLRERLGQNARRKYSEQFNPARIGAQMLALYKSVLREHRGQPIKPLQRRAA